MPFPTFFDDGLGFAGHYTDGATQLSYLQQRYYDPYAGRLNSVDPARSDFHRYAYAGNNPYKFIDPDGREAACVLRGNSCGIGSTSDEEVIARLSVVADFTPVIGDLKGFLEAAQDPTRANIAAAVIGMVPGAGDVAGKAIKAATKAADILKGTAGGLRAGKRFTASGKAEIDAANAARHGGTNTCENCGIEVVPGQKSQRGVTPPGNERQRDHIIPKSKGGDGDPSNGQILCRECNLKKGDEL